MKSQSVCELATRGPDVCEEEEDSQSHILIFQKNVYIGVMVLRHR